MTGSLDPSDEPTSGRQGEPDRLRELLDRAIPPEELERQTRSVAAPIAEEVRGSTGLVLFRVGREELGIDVMLCRRVVPIAPVHRIPHRSNDLFAGLCAVDGELMLAARLDRLLGLEHDPQGASRMLVLSDARGSWALPVDEVEGVRRFDESRFRAPPATVTRAVDGLTRALAESEASATIAVLDGPALLARFERSLA